MPLENLPHAKRALYHLESCDSKFCNRIDLKNVNQFSIQTEKVFLEAFAENKNERLL